MVNHDDINDLLARHFAGETLSPEANRRLSEWILENQTEFETLQSMVSQAAESPEPIVVDDEKAWETVVSRVRGKQKSSRGQVRFLTLWTGIAASIILVVWLLGINRSGKPDFAHYTTDNQSLTKDIILKDGSQVTLRRPSTLDFSVDSDGRRMAQLTGEAYFKVAKQNGKPFAVKTDALVVTVTGTAFSVRVDDPRNGRVTVEEGVVEVASDAKQLRLTKNQMAELKDGKLTQHEVTDVNAFAWRNRYLVFDQTPLSEALKKIEECYDVRISIVGNPQGCAITTKFTDSSLSEILDEIETIFHCQITSEGRHIVISDLNCL